MERIVLIGFMGVGKTTIGRRLAMRLSRDFYDTDSTVAKCEGMPVAEVVRKKGVKYFQGAEQFAVTTLMEKPNAVISTGGSTVLNDASRAALRDGSLIIWLQATADTIYRNTCHSRNRRPELQGKTAAEIGELLDQRLPYYQECDITVQVDGREIDDIVNELLQKIQRTLDAQ